jgi:hypothetical protein
MRLQVGSAELCMFCQEGRDERGSAKRRATSHHARLGCYGNKLSCCIQASIGDCHAATLYSLHLGIVGTAMACCLDSTFVTDSLHISGIIKLCLTRLGLAL